MIILEAIKSENSNTSFLVFKNEKGKKVTIPVSKSVGDLLSAYIKLISTASDKKVERGNEEISD